MSFDESCHFYVIFCQAWCLSCQVRHVVGSQDPTMWLAPMSWHMSPIVTHVTPCHPWPPVSGSASPFRSELRKFGGKLGKQTRSKKNASNHATSLQKATKSWNLRAGSHQRIQRTEMTLVLRRRAARVALCADRISHIVIPCDPLRWAKSFQRQ